VGLAAGVLVVLVLVVLVLVLTLLKSGFAAGILCAEGGEMCEVNFLESWASAAEV
jgi:hypothetical protein